MTDRPDVEAAVRAHAGRVLAGDAGAARQDLGPRATIDPPDLLERLAGARFHGFDLVAHARIGGHHVFKTRFDGPVTVVVQARWTRAETGSGWQMVELEVARTEPPGRPL